MRDTIEGLTETVDTVRFARLQEGGANQIIVGYTAQQEDNYLAVYAYQEGKLEASLPSPTTSTLWRTSPAPAMRT